MKIGTSNRLAHYQVEFREISEQTTLLQSQVAGLQSQIHSLQAYLSVNQGDRNARANLSKLVQSYNSMSSSINRNLVRLQTLTSKMQIENNKIAMSQQRAVLTANKVRGRSFMKGYNY